MSRELQHFTMANDYFNKGKDDLNTAIRLYQDLDCRRSLDLLQKSLEYFSLALHIFENNESEWIEAEVVEQEIFKCMKSAHRLQGILLFNLQLYQTDMFNYACVERNA